jgi:beta-lactamase class A
MQVLTRIAEESGLVRPAVVLTRLRDGATGAYRPDRPLYPASMIKVPLVAAGLILRGLGAIGPGPFPVSVANLTANDAPSPLVEGYQATFEELCTLAITRSDNVATNQLFDVVGRERAGDVVRSQLGLAHTGFRRKLSGSHPLVRDAEQFGRNTHPAGDAARLFRAIAENRFSGAPFLYSLLEQQQWNAKLSQGLDAGDRFAHKTGDTDETSHDGGILTTSDGERFVVVVYSASPSSESTDAHFAALMRMLLELVKAQPIAAT